MRLPRKETARRPVPSPWPRIQLIVFWGNNSYVPSVSRSPGLFPSAITSLIYPAFSQNLGSVRFEYILLILQIQFFKPPFLLYIRIFFMIHFAHEHIQRTHTIRYQNENDTTASHYHVAMHPPTGAFAPPLSKSRGCVFLYFLSPSPDGILWFWTTCQKSAFPSEWKRTLTKAHQVLIVDVSFDFFQQLFRCNRILIFLTDLFLAHNICLLSVR